MKIERNIFFIVHDVIFRVKTICLTVTGRGVPLLNNYFKDIHLKLI